MPDFNPEDTTLTGQQVMMLIDAGITGPYQIPTVTCPHPQGSPAAEEWWRHEWRVATTWAIIRGELAAADDSQENTPRLPAFPLHALPPVMRDLAVSIAENKGVPVDLAALLLLSTVALIAGPRLIISRGKDWDEALAEWALVILDSGNRKSPAFKVVEKVILRVERLLAEQYEGRIAARIRELETEIASMTGKGKADSDADGATPAAKAENATRAQKDKSEQVKVLAAELKQLQEEPGSPPRLLLGSGTTPEALERAMSDNQGSIGVFDAEAGAFNAVAGPYSNGTVTGIETILKSRDGDRIAANERIGRAVKTIPRAVLTYGITCQSFPLMMSLKKLQLREIGFHARWFYSVPEPVTKEDIDPPELDYHAVRRFGDMLEQILTAHPIIDPTVQPDDREWPTIQLSPVARKVHQELQQAFAERKQDDGDLAFMQDWANKYLGRVLRHAGLLHLAAGYGVNEQVSEQTMCDAIAIGDYAIAHAAEIFRRAPKMARGWNANGVEIEAVGRHKVERWIAASGKTHFTTRDVHRNMRRQSWCRSSDDVDAVLRELARDWVVRAVPRLDVAGRSLPGSPWWVPNPDLVFGSTLPCAA
jgi:replicative DNA helicase